MKEIFEMREYVKADGKKPFSSWIEGMRDVKGKAVVRARVNRVVLGIFGDCKRLTSAIWELRMDFGPGYRVYFAREGTSVILLLCGGDKAGQQRDIARAGEYWNDYRRRKYGK